jgi:hypothetical protein
MVFTQGQENFSVDRGLASLETDQIQKLKLRGDVVLGDIVFNTIDEDGVVWVLRDIENWWTAPPSDVPNIERGFGDGSYEVIGRFTSRPMNLSGVLLTNDPGKIEKARDRLIEACNLVRKGAWLKTGTSPTRAAYVYLSGDLQINTVNPRGRTEFSISLRAPDPIKYAWNDAEPDGYELVELPVRNAATGATGSTVITNIGNYPVPCIFEVTGPFSGPGTIFNRTTGELVVLTQSLKGRIGRSIVNKELSFSVTNPNLTDVARLTTTEPHDFSVGDNILIAGVGEPFNGDQVITSTPTSTTFTYNVFAADIRPVSFKSFTNNTATLETTVDHGFAVGDSILVNGVDGLFDRTATILSTPSPRTLTYAAIRSTPQTLSSTQLTSNIATLSTTQEHGFIVGEDVTISGAGVNYNGTFEILSVPSASSFTYAFTRTNSRDVVNKSMSNDIVTLTTSTAHGFLEDEGVNVTGVDLSLNGGYVISSRTNNTFRYRRPRATEIAVTIKAINSNVATLTTSSAHGFVEGERVVVQNVDSTFNGTYTITSLPSNTSFTYNKTASNLISTSVSGGRVRAASRKIRNREIIGNVATLITDSIHGAIFGERITITGMGAPFDGTRTITGIPFLNVVTFSLTSPNILLEKPVAIRRAARNASAVVTLTTPVAHGYSVGQVIRVTGIDSTFDGTHTITQVPATPSAPGSDSVPGGPTTFRYSTPGGAVVTEADAPDGAEVIKDFGFFEMPGTINSQVVSGGLATVGGSLPFASTTGSASVSNTLSRRPAAGNAIKKNDVQFTPGIANAFSIVSADILEIDTKDHVVSFNGQSDGARGRVDVLTDFIKLAPGENVIEFEDTGSPGGEANLQIFYRSGWLG